MANNPKIERGRYLAVAYGFNRILSQTELWKMISSQNHNLFGVKGLIKMGLFLHYTSSRPFAIFRLSNNSIYDFLMSLASCRWYNLDPIVFFSLSVSGSIKGLKELENSPIVENLMKLNIEKK